MSKDEFLRILRGKITGAMEQSEVESQIAYYSSYIEELKASGKSEEEAVAELGDPQLIAKTLDNAVEGGYLDSDYQGGSHAKQYNEGTQNTYSGSSSQSYSKETQNDSHENSYTSQGQNKASNGDKIKRVAITVLSIIAVLAIIFLFISTCFGIGSCLVGGFLPIIIVILIIGIIFSIFKRY